MKPEVPMIHTVESAPRRRGAGATSGVSWLVAALILLLWIALPAAPAGATLSRVGPKDPDTGFPSWIEDTGGLRLAPCLDRTNCSAPSPDAASAPSTPDNIGGRVTYWSARATVPTGSASLVLTTQGGFLPSDTPETGAQQVLNRIRIRADNLEPGATYEVTHPYGVETFTNVAGEIDFTEDVGCLRAPCGDFATALNGRVGPWLVWDTLGQASGGPPAGYVGDPAETHRVIGSPMIDADGKPQNYFEIRGPNVGGRGKDVARTDLFAVEGKISGPTAFASPAGGLHDGPQTVSLTASDPEAQIFYTTDGTTPTRNSTPYRDPLHLTETTTLKLVALGPADSTGARKSSPVLTETYEIEE